MKQFIIYGFASVLGKIAAVILLPFYTNTLTQEEYGAMALIIAFKGVIDLLSNFNIHSGVARDYYEESIDRTKLISTGFFSILFSSITIVVILYFSRSIWIQYILPIKGYEKAFIVMLLTVPAGSLFSFFAILTRFKKKAILFSAGTLLHLLVQIAITIYLVLILDKGILGVFYGILGGEIIGIVYFYCLNREYIIFTYDKTLIKRILFFALPTLPAILAGWLDSSLGQILIGHYVSVEDAGVYSIALRVSSVFLLLNTAFSNVWYPYIYENIKKNYFYEEVLKLYRLVIFILTVFAVNLALLSEEIIIILTNENYLSASKYLIILTIPMCVAIVKWFAIMGPNISRNTIYISYSTITGSAVNIILIIILLPIYGVVAVPISLGISRILSYFISAYYTRKEIQLDLPAKPILFLIFAVLISFILKQSNLSQYIIWSCLLIFNVVAVFVFFIKNKLLDQHF